MASRRNSEELIFEGRVTVNGSVCNTPQVGLLFHCLLASILPGRFEFTVLFFVIRVTNFVMSRLELTLQGMLFM